MSLSPTDSDKKVLRAFADRKPASNNRIESTGDRLNTIGFSGGSCIARWSGDRIIDFGYESGGKFGPALIRALKKLTAPNDWAKKNTNMYTRYPAKPKDTRWFAVVQVPITGQSPRGRKIFYSDDKRDWVKKYVEDYGLVPESSVKIVDVDGLYRFGLHPEATRDHITWNEKENLLKSRILSRKVRKNSQFGYKWFGIIYVAGKPKICLANEYKEDAVDAKNDLGLPRGLVKIVSRNKIYDMGLKPSPDGPDWAGENALREIRASAKRKNGSRYTARATAGRFWAGQSERFPWRRNPRAPSKYEHEYILQGNYGYGWDDLEFRDKTSFGLRELRQLRKTYESNQRGAYRIISRKTLRK